MTDNDALFPVATGREKGYDRERVDGFLSGARAVFETGRPSPETDAADALDASAVRSVSFPLRRGGYRVAAVDAALARIEDAFAARERERAIRATGADAWVERARADAQDILDRLQRPGGERFDRVGVLRFGYAPKEVDIVADRICAYLSDGIGVSVEQVRQSAFRMTRNGYREQQVDAVLDAVIEVMLAVR